MLKKMRWRFIAAAMAAFCAVLLLLLCFINLWNYHLTTQQQDETLQRLLEVEQLAFEHTDRYGGPPFDRMQKFSPEVPYMIRFFSVHYDAAGAVTEINQDYIASISRETAQEYAAHVLDGTQERGYYSGYRYFISRSTDGVHVLFLNSERELQHIRSILLITVTIAGCCLCVVFVLVVLFSKRAIAPYVRNLEAQKQFITNASHELKTPLTAIATSADVLAMEQEDNEWVCNIQDQAGRLSKLITNLVTLSRLDEEDPFPQRVEFSLSDALWEITEPFLPLARAKGKHCAQDIADSLTVAGDRAAIQQMVSILMDNAIKYSPPGGKITLTARQSGKRAEITVANTCISTDGQDIDHLFDRFFRADRSHSNSVSGTGIGLSIARATAEAHGGTITAEKHGELMLFRVRL